jgi:hypothetical protein
VTQIRVDYAALARAAQDMSGIPQRFADAHQAVGNVRGASAGIGDPEAAALGDELLRQLGWFLDLAATSGVTLTRALVFAAQDYAQADRAAMSLRGAE